MRFLTLAGLAAGADRVRRLQMHGTTLAALVGDERRTHAVLWVRLSDGAELRRVEVPVGDCALDPALSPDLATLAYAEADEGGSHFVLENAEGSRRTIPFPDFTGEGPVDSCACLAFSGGGLLRASFDDGSLAGWDVRGAVPPLTDVMTEEYPPAVAMAHGPVPALGVEGHVIACRGSMLYLRISDRHADPVWCPHETEPVAAAFAPNGALFAVSFTDRVQVWGTSAPFRPPEHATLPVAGVRALAFSPDSATLATAGADGRVLFWSGDMAAPRSGKGWGIGALGGVAFAPDGFTCVVGGEGGRLAVWDLADEPAPSPPPPPPPLPPAPPPKKKRTRKKAEPPPPQAGPGQLAWVAAEGGVIPPGAVAAGHEADGQKLYAARGARKGQVVPGKARPGLGGACIGIDDHEITCPAYEVLVGELSWRACRSGEVPPGALPSGHDRTGQPLYLARARVGGGLHPGKIAPGMSGALVPYGGAEFPAERYEVLVGGQAVRQQPAGEVFLSWDFENTMSVGAVSISAGIPADPSLASGLISQTGGGPAEVFGESGTVFLTHHLGSKDVFAWITLVRPVLLVAVEVRHWHNHNPGYPTHPDYEIELQIDSGDGWKKAGEPLLVSDANSGGTDRIEVGTRLEAGSHKLRWHPRKLKRGRDTSSEFFALKDVRLLGMPEG